MRSTRMRTTCVRCALQVFATEIQEKDGDEEEILDAYESCTDIRKKIRSRKRQEVIFLRPSASSRDSRATPTL